MRRKPLSIYARTIILWLAFIALSFGLIAWQWEAPWPLLVVAALNSATFILYGLDKMLAIQKGVRIPEYILYLAAFTGGAGGALISMYLLNHKTSKKSFQFGLALVILAEGLIVAYFLK